MPCGTPGSDLKQAHRQRSVSAPQSGFPGFLDFCQVGPCARQTNRKRGKDWRATPAGHLAGGDNAQDSRRDMVGVESQRRGGATGAFLATMLVLLGLAGLGAVALRFAPEMW